MSSFTIHRLSYGPNPLHFADLYVPADTGPHPVAILIHGGFWQNPYKLTLMDKLGRNLATRGIAAWNIEYRRIGDDGGGWPGTLQDVAAASDRLGAIASMYALDMQRVISVGHSAGGHLALWLAARFRLAPGSDLAPHPDKATRIRGAVSLAGVTDLAQAWHLKLGQEATDELLGGGPQQVPERYATASPAELLPLSIPQVLIHGTEDDRVPLHMS
ncbi:MAG: alpha/beta hydrolase, partial [Ktedonobacteraceae bacterium]|nr:alpha/beta hydrolase [Ktedonobacteraceae bacterium]